MLAEGRPARLRPVRVVEACSVAATTAPRAPLVVRTAGGLVIEGLDLDAVTTILRALS